MRRSVTSVRGSRRYCGYRFYLSLPQRPALAREIVGDVPFIEVFVSTDLSICEQRDPKGLYRKARAGDITGFTGIDAPYEPPADPELTLDTSALSVDQSVAKIMEHISAVGIIQDIIR